jgi:hypothetical protein
MSKSAIVTLYVLSAILAVTTAIYGVNFAYAVSLDAVNPSMAVIGLWSFFGGLSLTLTLILITSKLNELRSQQR